MNAIARQHISEGTSTVTDGWRGYNGYPSLTRECNGKVRHMRLTRRVVFHAVEFVMSEGVHINGIENAWSVLKRNAGAEWARRLRA
jgi:hypothetical protein